MDLGLEKRSIIHAVVDLGVSDPVIRQTSKLGPGTVDCWS
jgi:hypothetical protein